MTVQERNVTIGVLIAVLIALGAYYWWNLPGTNYLPTPTPYEGSAGTPPVSPGATSTPTGPSTASVEGHLAETSQVLGVSFRPLAVTEDSRCPTNVQCIQAGTVRLRVQVESDVDSASEKVLTLGTPTTVNAGTIELVSVTPLKDSTKQIKGADYRFIFKVIRNLDEFDLKG